MKELFNGIYAIWLFLMPRLCIAKAMKGGIVSDFGCWFWIDADGLTVCRRHQQRSLAAWF